MWLIAIKEMMDFLYSPKFLLLFAAAAILVFVSVANGYYSYEKELSFAESSQKESMEKLEENSSFRRVSYTVTRKPSRLAIFDPGVADFIGRKTRASSYDSKTSRRPSIREVTSDSKFGEDPILAVFGELSLSFVVSVIFSLFSILLGYNTISGEKENGTLKLILATGTSRTSFFFGKIIGAFIPLILLLVVPLLMSIIFLLILTDVSFTVNDFMALGLMIAAYLIYIFLFFIISLTCSTFSKKSFVAFMASLIIWVAIVAIIPKAVTQAAQRASGTPNIADYYKRSSKFRAQVWKEESKARIHYINNAKVKRSEFRSVYRKFRNENRKKYSERINHFTKQMQQEFRRSNLAFEKNLENMARMSPYASMHFISQGSANTDHRLGHYMVAETEKFEKVLDEFANRKRVEKEKEQENYQYKREYKIAPDANGHMKLKFTNVKNERVKLDLSGFPRFGIPDPSMDSLISKFAFDYAFLIMFAIISMITGFFRFQTYDVR